MDTCQEEVGVGLLGLFSVDGDPVALRRLVGQDGGARPHHERGRRRRRRGKLALAQGRRHRHAARKGCSMIL